MCSQDKRSNQPVSWCLNSKVDHILNIFLSPFQISNILLYKILDFYFLFHPRYLPTSLTILKQCPPNCRMQVLHGPQVGSVQPASDASFTKMCIIVSLFPLHIYTHMHNHTQKRGISHQQNFTRMFTKNFVQFSNCFQNST